MQRIGAKLRIPAFAITMAALVGCLVWSYWPTLMLVFRSWTRDPVHSDFGPSHGAFVPVFALIVLCARRHMFCEDAEDAAIFHWLGTGILLFTLPLRWFAGYTDYVAVDAFSLLPALVGITLMVGGRSAFRAAWPALAMLLLMLPWPHRLEMMVTDPLRYFLAAASTFVLQTLGYPVFVEGPVIRVERIPVEVIDACSGLGMLLTFSALAITIALLSGAPLPNRIILVVSSLVFAVLANVLRISATAAAFYELGPGPGTAFVHDLAGWLMMPVALALLWSEVRLLECLLIQEDRDKPLPMALVINPQLGAPARSAS